MKNQIRIVEAIEIMNASVTGNKPRAFAISFCTADRNRGTGGERIVFDRAVLTKPMGMGKKPTSQNTSTNERRYPINLKNLTSSEIRKVNIDLIEEINGHPIV